MLQNFELGLKERPTARSTSGRRTKSPEATESQSPNYKDKWRRHSWLTQQSFNHFLLLLSSRIQANILDLPGVGVGGMVHSAPKWWRWKEDSKLEHALYGEPRCWCTTLNRSTTHRASGWPTPDPGSWLSSQALQPQPFSSCWTSTAWNVFHSSSETYVCLSISPLLKILWLFLQETELLNKKQDSLQFCSKFLFCLNSYHSHRHIITPHNRLFTIFSNSPDTFPPPSTASAGSSSWTPFTSTTCQIATYI